MVSVVNAQLEKQDSSRLFVGGGWLGGKGLDRKQTLFQDERIRAVKVVQMSTNTFESFPGRKTETKYSRTISSDADFKARDSKLGPDA
jgi:hypothetical protein